MRLSEILTEVTASDEKTLQNREWKSPREVASWLRRKGYKQKGTGSFGAVFAKPGKDRLIKISRRGDACWLRFAHWTLKMTTNPSVPYIDWVRTYEDERGTEFFIAVVERLQPFNTTAIRNTRDLPGLAYLIAYYDPVVVFEHDLYSAVLSRLEREGIIDHELTKRGPSYEMQAAKWLKKNAKGGRQFINTLRSAEKKAFGGCDFDVHDGNIMYRPSDRRLVVIDPLADLSA